MEKMDKIERYWDKRSKMYKDAPVGVLPKSFPPVMNEHLHKWMLARVTDSIHKTEFKALDIGAGYGRLAEELIRKYSNATVDGVDISAKYVELYNKKMKKSGTATKADIRHLPFKAETYDYVYCVTTLMYLSRREDQLQALSEMLRVLKKDGVLILIERNSLGHSLITLGGIVTKLRGKANREIPAVSFTPGNIKELVKQLNANISSKRGIPFWTLLFYKHYFVARFLPFLARAYYVRITILDRLFSRWTWPSLYVAYVIKQ